MEFKQIKCLNCNGHFEQLRPEIKEVITSKHFLRDAPDFDTTLIVDCQHEHFTKLHKFEETIDGNHIFRAVKRKIHYVYAVDKNKRLVFLRAFNNFKDYKKFLNEKKIILKIIQNEQL